MATTRSQGLFLAAIALLCGKKQNIGGNLLLNQTAKKSILLWHVVCHFVKICTYNEKKNGVIFGGCYGDTSYMVLKSSTDKWCKLLYSLIILIIASYGFAQKRHTKYGISLSTSEVKHLFIYFIFLQCSVILLKPCFHVLWHGPWLNTLMAQYSQLAVPPLPSRSLDPARPQMVH